jgi:hypothetical protein
MPHKRSRPYNQGRAQQVMPRNGRYFYVTMVRDDGKGALLLGPYVSHMSALSAVARGARLANEVDPTAWFNSFGTSSLSARRKTAFGR